MANINSILSVFQTSAVEGGGAVMHNEDKRIKSGVREEMFANFMRASLTYEPYDSYRTVANVNVGWHSGE